VLGYSEVQLNLGRTNVINIDKRFGEGVGRWGDDKMRIQKNHGSKLRIPVHRKLYNHLGPAWAEIHVVPDNHRLAYLVA
jgi:hypothetical protein